MTDLTTRFHSALRSDCRIQPEDLILVGVSGGIDSMFLLSQLHEIGQPVTAAVFDHGLRPEAAEECEFVASFCAGHSIPCVTGKGDAAACAAVHGMGIEEAARELRYRFLFETAAKLDAAAVAAAHHANDQAETVLMHILRGSGLDGISAMRPRGYLKEFSQTIPLIRPLLGITRREIEEYAAETGLEYREDYTNKDQSYTRNRVRLDLLPKLENEYNPQIIASLCRLAETAALDKEILDGDCEEALRYAAFCGRQGDRYLPLQSARSSDQLKDLTAAEWSRKTYCAFSRGMRFRMLRLILSLMNADLSEIGYRHLKEIDEFFLTARTNQTRQISAGLWLKSVGDKAKTLKDPEEKQWKYPQFSRGWTLCCEEKTIEPKDIPFWQEKARLHPETAILDARQLAGGPFLRRIRPGERFDPYGLGGRTQKISDFLVNNKIPKEYRADLAAAADEAGIIWIPGLRVSSRCALEKNTRHIMILTLKK